MSRAGLSLGGWTRDIQGCIATFDRDGERWSRQFATRGFIQAAAEYADSEGAKVVTISTPETIWRDLQGTRASLTMRLGPQTGIEKPLDARIDIPERTLLGKIGRRDLLLGWEAQPKHG